MVPVPRLSASSSTRYLHVLYLASSSGVRYVSRLVWGHYTRGGGEHVAHFLERRTDEIDHADPKFIVFVVLIPILVLLSGLFAGLTLGYMSLDETQLNVLSISGTPEQREYASKIMPIRKNGHLLLVTLLLANMIVNESLPVISDPILGGGVQSVVVSTVLIVIFSEIIPQSLFTRHGLYLGAKMARFTRVLIYALGIISWPVAKFLEFVLGPHHGIIYRRAELKELIAMHSRHATLGGDLKLDTVTIIGATLDLQEKVVKQAMTPIDDVFMLSIDSKLDYNLLKLICETGHSRVPVYEEIEIPIPPESPSIESDGVLPTLSGITAGANSGKKERTRFVKKILGIFLVKNCVMLDPKDATPIRNMPLNKVPFVPNNEPLLGILDKFQEGRSHMAIVSRFSVDKAQSVKQAVKRGLTQRLRERVGMADSDSSESSSSSSEDEEKTIGFRKRAGLKKTRFLRSLSLEEGKEPGSLKEGSRGGEDDTTIAESVSVKKTKSKETKQSPVVAMANAPPLEQSMPTDAVLAKEGADEFLQSFDPAVMPLGIITLEDVLEELIGEEIYDEFDVQGAHGDPYQIPSKEELVSVSAVLPSISGEQQQAPPAASGNESHTKGGASSTLKPIGLKGLGFLRSRSAPPVQRDALANQNSKVKEAGIDEEEEKSSEGPLFLSTNIISHSDDKYNAESDGSHSLPPVRGGGDGAGLETLLEGVAAGLPVLGLRSAPTTRAPSPSLGFMTKATSNSNSQQSLLGGLPHHHHHHAIALSSRSNSPAPALEAVLLDRKRRLVSGSSSNTTAAAASVTGGVVVTAGGHALMVNPPCLSGSATAARGAVQSRGTTFKSSPLTLNGAQEGEDVK